MLGNNSSHYSIEESRSILKSLLETFKLQKVFHTSLVEKKVEFALNILT